MNYIGTVYTAVLLAIAIIEDVKDGEAGTIKREEAIALVKQLITGALGYYPAWLPDALLGAAIDFLVSTLNKLGIFDHAA